MVLRAVDRSDRSPSAFRNFRVRRCPRGSKRHSRRGRGEDGMGRQLLVGAFVSAINIVIHAVLTLAVIRVARTAAMRSTSRPSLHLAFAMTATSLVLMVAHALQVIIWSVA